MRTLLLACLATLACAESVLTPDDVYGHWEVDAKAVTKDQKAAAESAAAVDGFGVTFTLKFARVTTSSADDGMFAGQWRLDDATATTATAVVLAKTGEERQYHLTKKGKLLIVDELPGKLALSKK